MTFVESNISVTPARAARSQGLDDVVVADTEISDVDGQGGRLTLRGHTLQSLAGRVSFEAMSLLLWEGRLPTDSEEAAWSAELALKRQALLRELPRFASALALPDVMDALRSAMALLDLRGDERAVRVALSAAGPVVLSAFMAQRQGRALAPSDLADGTARALLRGVTGRSSEAHVRALDTYLVSVAEHGMNASTFVARIVTSTGSDSGSAVVAALGALKGPLHGGAPGPVLDLLDRIRSPERAVACLSEELAAGRRIMGMGHRVYRVRDPRAEVLERATRELGPGPHQQRVELSRHVEQEAVRLLAERYPGRNLCANVEFYTAVLLEALAIPRELFTGVFACGRVAGYLAHIAEQRRNARIVRPASRYVGPRAPSAT